MIASLLKGAYSRCMTTRFHAGMLGGLKTKEKYGTEHFRKIGRKGGAGKRDALAEFTHKPKGGMTIEEAMAFAKELSELPMFPNAE